MYEPLQKSGHSLCSVDVCRGRPGPVPLASISVPELCAQRQTPKGLSSGAGVGEERVGVLRAGVVWRFWSA